MNSTPTTAPGGTGDSQEDATGTEERLTREEAYAVVRLYLWCAVNTRAQDGGSGSVARARLGMAPFVWSPVRPEPIVPATNGSIRGPQPARDFPNDNYEWGHPTFDVYMRAYKALEAPQP